MTTDPELTICMTTMTTHLTDVRPLNTFSADRVYTTMAYWDLVFDDTPRSLPINQWLFHMEALTHSTLTHNSSLHSIWTEVFHSFGICKLSFIYFRSAAKIVFHSSGIRSTNCCLVLDVGCVNIHSFNLNHTFSMGFKPRESTQANLPKHSQSTRKSLRNFQRYNLKLTVRGFSKLFLDVHRQNRHKEESLKVTETPNKQYALPDIRWYLASPQLLSTGNQHVGPVQSSHQ